MAHLHPNPQLGDDDDDDDDSSMMPGAGASRQRIGTRAETGSLAHLVNLRQSQALNSTQGHALAAVLGVETPASASESDALPLLYSDASTDSEQLLVTIEFNEAVRLEALVIHAGVCAVPDSAPPRAVKLFAQQPNYSFDECESQKPTFEATLTAANLAGAPVKLPLVRFASITSVTLFFPSNTRRDATTTFINRLSFQGIALAGTNMSNLRSSGCGSC
jgi:hypothetical protein